MTLRRRSPWLALVLVAALGACDDVGPTAPSQTGTTRLTLSATLASGEEATWCQYLLPAQGTTDGVSIQAIAHTSAGGGATHHIIWYQMAETPASVAGQLAPFRCDDGVHLRKVGILYAPPAASGTLRWPDDVAAHLEPDAVTLVEWHAINYHATAVETSVHLDLTQPPAPARLRAGTLLFYDWFVHLPPAARHTARTRCRIRDDVTLMWASQHMHQRGIGFTATLLDARGEPVRELLQTDSWDADARWFEVGIPLSRGQWVEFACTYDNPDDYAVIEGDRVDDEMCMFVGGYYPQIAAPLGETCALGEGSGPRFDGDATCAESLSCLADASDRVSAHACWNDTRGEDSAALVELAWRCASAECPDSCRRDGFSTACLSCLDTACGGAMTACTASADMSNAL